MNEWYPDFSTLTGILIMKTVIAAVAMLMTGAVHAECDSNRIYSYVREGLSQSEIRLICGIRPEIVTHPSRRIVVIEPVRSPNNCCCMTVQERRSQRRVYATKPSHLEDSWFITSSTTYSMPVQHCSGVRYDSEYSRTRSFCDGFCD